MSGPEMSGVPDEEQPPDEESGPDPLVGTVIGERYRVDEKLGVGGVGAVYRAEHVLMKKPVAVKVLHREMTVVGEVVKRFEREAIAAGRIDHPNVTVATDFGKLEDGAFYLVLEYVPGKSLSAAIKEGPFSVERALFITRQVAAALAAAHAASIVHRDLKPDNVMLIERGGTKDFVKVLDFGIAKVSEDGAGQLTRIGSVFGTPQYMAPEQAAGKPVDYRADLYSLGLVLYEMLAGKPAFGSMELVAILTKQLTEPPPPLPDTVDADVTAFVTRLVEKDPAARVQTAQEVVAWIDARLGPLALPPDSTVLGVPSVRGGSVRGVPAVTAADAPVPSSRRRAEALQALSNLVDVARDHSSTLAKRVVRGDSVRVAGRDVPARVLVAGGAILLAGVIALSASHKTNAPSVPGSAGAAHSPPPEPELGRVIAKAEDGDRAALANLEGRPEAKRSAAEWMAIARGRARLMEYRPALLAFGRAVEADESLANDDGMLRAVRRAADDESTQKLAFDMCVNALGAGGADVLFDVWASTSEKTSATQLAKSLLEKSDIRDHASSALKIALELRHVTRCDEAKKLVLRAKDDADERAFRPLNTLSARRGCGFLGLADCFSCLRQGDDLQEALKAVQSRKGPRF